MSSQDYKSVSIRLNEADWHGLPWETLWAEPSSHGSMSNIYTIMNSPFFATDVSFLDKVAIEAIDGIDVVVEVVESSGNSTYMLLIRLLDEFDRLWLSLEGLGCSYESTSDVPAGWLSLYSVNVPATTNIYEVYAILEMGEAEGTWEFQEGKVGHRLNSN